MRRSLLGVLAIGLLAGCGSPIAPGLPGRESWNSAMATLEAQMSQLATPTQPPDSPVCLWLDDAQSLPAIDAGEVPPTALLKQDADALAAASTNQPSATAHTLVMHLYTLQIDAGYLGSVQIELGKLRQECSR